MIYIDSSGWGSLLSGVIIGFYNSEWKKFYTKMIPVKFFQGVLFKKQKYLSEAQKIVRRGIIEVGYSRNITLCRGYMLRDVKEILDKDSLIHEAEIGEPLQSYLERKFATSLKKIGVPQKSNGAHCLSFDDQLAWVREDPRRVRYVKTGWTSWQDKYARTLFEKKLFE